MALNKEDLEQRTKRFIKVKELLRTGAIRVYTSKDKIYEQRAAQVAALRVESGTETPLDVEALSYAAKRRAEKDTYQS
tara:strand:- start:487 stop:720 length:234 start_codon:yes stop_codon:yes gene_type:complete